MEKGNGGEKKVEAEKASGGEKKVEAEKASGAEKKVEAEKGNGGEKKAAAGKASGGEKKPDNPFVDCIKELPASSEEYLDCIRRKTRLAWGEYLFEKAFGKKEVESEVTVEEGAKPAAPVAGGGESH